MIETIELITAGWLIYCLYFTIRAISLGQRQTILCAIPIHFIFCGLPLILQCLFGTPAFEVFPGFQDTCRDPLTCVIYCLYVATVPVFWWIHRGPNPSVTVEDGRSKHFRGTGIIDYVLPVLLVAPVLVVFLAPDPEIYLSYSIGDRGLYELEREQNFHVIVSKLCQLSIVSAAIMLFRARSVRSALMMTIPAVCAACWLHGKRNAVVLALALMLYGVWRRGEIDRRRIWVVGAISVLFAITYSIFYQTQVRFNASFVSKRSIAYWIENFRVDYGRDLSIKLEIYDLVHPGEVPTIEYPGQSVWIASTVIVPRSLWDKKPESYSYFVTNAAMGRPSAGGGGVTTSCLGEAIPNFWLFGFLIGPLLPLVVSRVGDQSSNEIVKVLTVFIVILLQTAHLNAWAVPGYLWLFLVVKERLTLREDSQAPLPIRSRSSTALLAGDSHRVI